MIMFSNLLDERSHLKEFLSVESAYRFENQKNHYDMINAKVILHGAWNPSWNVIDSFQEHFLLPTTFF